MTGVAAHARHDRVEMQASPGDRSRRVAAEAFDPVALAHAAAGGFLDGLRLGLLGAHRQVKTVQGIVEADATFVVDPIALEDVGLTGLPASESPKEGRRQRLSA